jgi:LPXTG-site transpeptidase (sortase) family protein
VQRLRERQARRRKCVGRVLVVLATMAVALLPALRAPNLPAEPVATGAVPSPGVQDVERPARQPHDDPIGFAARAQLPPVEVPSDTLVPLGQVRIPKLGLETPFFSGVHEDILARGVGHWPGTPRVGTPGNAVLSGHRTTHTAPFGDLDLLEPGDAVLIDTGAAAPLTYEILGTQVVPQERYVDVVLAQPSDRDQHLLTLFACHPKGSAAQRIVVQARLR